MSSKLECWRGKVTEALDNLKTGQAKMELKQDKFDERMDSFDHRLTKLYVYLAVAAFVAGIIGNLIGNHALGKFIMMFIR